MRNWLGALTGAAVVLAASSAWALDVGDKAPPLDVTNWVQGDPVVIADGAGKKVFLDLKLHEIPEGTSALDAVRLAKFVPLDAKGLAAARASFRAGAKSTTR